jgi:hypothetical protein
LAAPLGVISRYTVLHAVVIAFVIVPTAVAAAW